MSKEWNSALASAVSATAAGSSSKRAMSSSRKRSVAGSRSGRQCASPAAGTQ
jgi:hypothetical protein